MHCSGPVRQIAQLAEFESNARAAAQKKVPGGAKNAYLMLTRKGPLTLGPATSWPIPLRPLSDPTTIKKYANRRLYNTASSAYVTLADLAKMVKGGEDFVVFDAKSNEDITRSVLTQIIFEQEGIEGQSLLPTTFLRQLIRFYGDSMQALLPSYLEFSIDRFSGEQQAMREAATRMFGPEAFSAGSFAALQEMTKKNFAAFNQALAMFSPFVGGRRPQNCRQRSRIPRAISTNCAVSSPTCRSVSTRSSKKAENRIMELMISQLIIR